MTNSLGSIIKLKRMEKNITQEELCYGICANSYLSRIENNRVVPNDQIYMLLFERLGLDFVSFKKKSVQVDEKIEEWYRDLVNGKLDGVDVEEIQLYALSSDARILLKFDIAYSRYLLMNKHIDQAETKINNINKVIIPEYSREFFLYTDVIVLYYLLKGKYSEAIIAGQKLLNISGYENLAADYELGNIYYNLAFGHKNLYSYETAYYYINKALNIFKDGYYLERALDCHIILGICYNNLKKWNHAIQTYKLAKKLLNYLSPECQDKYLAMIYNILGNCYEYQNNYRKAVYYYLKTLQFQNKSILTMINLIRSYFMLQDRENAIYWLNNAMKLKNNNMNKTYQVQIDIFSVILSNQITMDSIIQIQKYSINYFISKDDWKLTVRYCLLFANLYESKSAYKKANHMNKLAFKANEKLQRGGD